MQVKNVALSPTEDSSLSPQAGLSVGMIHPSSQIPRAVITAAAREGEIGFREIRECPWQSEVLRPSDCKAQAGIKISRRNSNNLRHTDDPILMAESEEELKSLLMKVKEESK